MTIFHYRTILFGARYRIFPILLIILFTVSTRAQADGWVDRIEGDLVVIIHEPAEGGDIWVEEIRPLSDLPAGVSEGDAIVDGAVDRDATVAMLKRILALQHRLRGD